MNLRNGNNIAHIYNENKITDKMLQIVAQVQYNNLPRSIQDVQNISNFKEKLKVYLESN